MNAFEIKARVDEIWQNHDVELKVNKWLDNYLEARCSSPKAVDTLKRWC